MGGVEWREMRAERQRRKRRRNWVERLQRDNPSAVTSRITIDQPLRSFSSVCHRHLPASPSSSPLSWLSSLPPSFFATLSLFPWGKFMRSTNRQEAVYVVCFFFFLYVIATSASESSNIPGLRGTKRLCVCQRTTLNSSQGGWFVCSLACWKVLAGASLISVIMSVAR